MMLGLQNLGFGFQTFILGMFIIFLALAVIWFIVAMMGKIFTRKSKSKKKTDSPEKPVAPQNPAEKSVVTANSEDSAEIVAAIAAAISCYENKPLGSFRVVSFKKR